MAKQRYFKLGKKATSFTDPKTGLNLSGNEIKAVDANVFMVSKFAKEALTNGHIVEVTQQDMEKQSKIGFHNETGTPANPEKGKGKVKDEEEEDEEEEDEEEEDEEEEEEEPKKAVGKAADNKTTTGGKAAGK